MKHIIRGWIALIITLVTLGGPTTASSYTIDTTSSPSVLTGLWWNANESGWGLTVTQQYGIIFVAMYTYDSANNPIWYVITNCPVVAGGCTGDIFKVRGGSPLTANWAPNLGLTKVGTGTLAFSDANTAAMNFTIDGIAGSKALTRQIFATAPPVSTSTFPINYNGFVLSSLTLNFVNGKCLATLTITNPFAVAAVFPAFDIISTSGAGSLIFGTSISGTSTDTSEVIIIGNTVVPSCNGFTLVFNPAISSYVIYQR